MKILLLSFLIFFQPISLQMLSSLFIVLMLMVSTNMNNIYNYSTGFNLDLISISLMVLSLWILILINLSQFNFKMTNSLIKMFLMLNITLMLSFSSTNILLFYFFFEWSLIPIFFIIMGWGYQLERMKSSFYLLMYTLYASLPLLVMIIIILSKLYVMNMSFIFSSMMVNMNMLYSIMMFLAFLVKFPMFFFHQWLPKAHVEAPVGGSMILAGILLKLGGYGMIRMSFFMNMSNFFLFIMMFALLGGSILSIVCLMNSDMKVMIAYSSVVHMALIIVNLISKNLLGLIGSMIIMVAHGLCSSGMFSCANMIYERTHSRMIMLNKGFLNFFPIMSVFWFLLCMANFSGPFTMNLLGEILLILNLVNMNWFLLIFIFFLSFFSATYSLILYANIQQGQNNNNMFIYNNITMRELLVLFSHIWPLLILLTLPMLM